MTASRSELPVFELLDQIVSLNTDRRPQKTLIRRLLPLITLNPKEIFIFAVLRSFVFKYHISVRLSAVLGESVAGAML